jgi:hypothetical protein
MFTALVKNLEKLLAQRREESLSAEADPRWFCGKVGKNFSHKASEGAGVAKAGRRMPVYHKENRTLLALYRRRVL